MEDIDKIWRVKWFSIYGTNSIYNTGTNNGLFGAWQLLALCNSSFEEAERTILIGSQWLKGHPRIFLKRVKYWSHLKRINPFRRLNHRWFRWRWIRWRTGRLWGQHQVTWATTWWRICQWSINSHFASFNHLSIAWSSWANITVITLILRGRMIWVRRWRRFFRSTWAMGWRYICIWTLNLFMWSIQLGMNWLILTRILACWTWHIFIRCMIVPLSCNRQQIINWMSIMSTLHVGI